MVGFAGVLWTIAPDLVLFIFFYAVLGTSISVCVFGRPIVALNQARLAKEANMRFALVRVRENAESVAFYKAGSATRKEVGGRLQVLVQTLVELITWRRNLSLFQMSFHYATVIVPAMILAPRYFTGEIEFGVISQGSMAFSAILAGLSFVVNKFDTLSGLVAETARLHHLLTALQATAADGTAAGGGSGEVGERAALLGPEDDVEDGLGGGISLAPLSAADAVPGGAALRVSGLTLETPAGAERRPIRLCSGLSFELAAGDALLVRHSRIRPAPQCSTEEHTSLN